MFNLPKLCLIVEKNNEWQYGDFCHHTIVPAYWNYKYFESMEYFFRNIMRLVNIVINNEETLDDQPIIEKVLRTISPILDHIVIEIDSSQTI